jgi:hypothetical protein
MARQCVEASKCSRNIDVSSSVVVFESGDGDAAEAILLISRLQSMTCRALNCITGLTGGAYWAWLCAGQGKGEDSAALRWSWLSPSSLLLLIMMLVMVMVMAMAMVIPLSPHSLNLFFTLMDFPP